MGGFGPLYPPAVVMIAGTVVVTPIVAAFARQTVEDLREEYDGSRALVGGAPAWEFLVRPRTPSAQAFMSGETLH
jgi:hypothetical protein